MFTYNKDVSPPPQLDVDIIFIRPSARALYALHGAAGQSFPEPATPRSAGCDIRACIDAEFVVFQPGERQLVAAGIGLQVRTGGWAPFVYSRSGLGAVSGLTVAQGVGVIDPDYTGEIFVYLLNTSQESITLERGERMAQIVFQPYAMPKWKVVDKLDSTSRGNGSFGHSGLE